MEWVNGKIDPIFLRSGTVGWRVAFGNLQLAPLNFDNWSFSFNTDTIPNSEDVLLLWLWIRGNGDGGSVVNLEIGFADEIGKCCRVRKRRENVRNASHCWSIRVCVESNSCHFCWNRFDSSHEEPFCYYFSIQTDTDKYAACSFALSCRPTLFLSFQPFISYEYYSSVSF